MAAGLQASEESALRRGQPEAGSSNILTAWETQMKSAFTFSFAALLTLPALSCAQDRGSAERRHSASSARPTADRRHPSDTDDPNPSRRLESVTWNSVKHELTWVISKGEKKEGASFKALASANYVINMDDATMSFSGQTRRFSKEEAANVHVLMDLIAKYAVDSTVWWDDGQGEPLDGNGKERKATPEKEKRREQNDNTPTLHVSWGNAGRCPTVQNEIQFLERKLALLRLMQQSAGKTRVHLASYSPDKY